MPLQEWLFEHDQSEEAAAIDVEEIAAPAEATAQAPEVASSLTTAPFQVLEQPPIPPATPRTPHK